MAAAEEIEETDADQEADADLEEQPEAETETEAETLTLEVDVEDLPPSTQTLLADLVAEFGGHVLRADLETVAGQAAAQRVQALYDNQDQVREQLGADAPGGGD